MWMLVSLYFVEVWRRDVQLGLWAYKNEFSLHQDICVFFCPLTKMLQLRAKDTYIFLFIPLVRELFFPALTGTCTHRCVGMPVWFSVSSHQTLISSQLGIPNHLNIAAEMGLFLKAYIRNVGDYMPILSFSICAPSRLVWSSVLPEIFIYSSDTL